MRSLEATPNERYSPLFELAGSTIKTATAPGQVNPSPAIPSEEAYRFATSRGRTTCAPDARRLVSRVAPPTTNASDRERVREASPPLPTDAALLIKRPGGYVSATRAAEPECRSTLIPPER